jgi:hypothetical protein
VHDALVDVASLVGPVGPGGPGGPKEKKIS